MKGEGLYLYILLGEIFKIRVGYGGLLWEATLESFSDITPTFPKVICRDTFSDRTIAMLFCLTMLLIELIQWIRVSKIKYTFVFQAYCKKIIKNCMQKILVKGLGMGNIRILTKLWRIMTTHKFNIGNVG